MGLSMGQRKAVTKKLAASYKRGSRAEKSRILDELVEPAGWYRGYARASLRAAGTVKLVKPRAARPAKFGPRVIACLVTWRMLTRHPRRQAPRADACRHRGPLAP